MDVNLGQLIVWLITGALAGFLAGRMFRGRGFGLLGDVIIGLLGALLGGALFKLLDIRISGLPTLTFSLADLVVAIIGAVVLLVIVQILARRR